MTEEEFDQTMRSFVKRRPFLPFVVELLDGERIVIANRHVAFGGGAAGFLSRKEGLVGFSKDEVRSFRYLSPEAADYDSAGLVGCKSQQRGAKRDERFRQPIFGGERQAMTAEEFDQTMRSFVKRRPFFPFEVELLDGRRIVIANRHVALGTG